jgi:superfamily I DNA/RNA helicase
MPYSRNWARDTAGLPRGSDICLWHLAEVGIREWPLCARSGRSTNCHALVVRVDTGRRPNDVDLAALTHSPTTFVHSLFIVGDAHQRIYGRKASMTKCGIDVRGRSRKLKICYRTSDEIRRWAVAVMEGVSVDDLDEASDDLRGYRSLFHGPALEVILAKTSAGEMNALAEWIENCKDDGIDESDVCILSRTNPGLKEVGETLRQKGYKTVLIVPNEADNRSKTGIRLSTMHRSKGLEFSAVALVRVNEDVVPPKGLLNMAADAAIRKALIANEKSLIHVSATRAKRKLFVSSSGQPSGLIAHLEPAQREPAE